MRPLRYSINVTLDGCCDLLICKCDSASVSVHPYRQPTNRFAARGLRPQLAPIPSTRGV